MSNNNSTPMRNLYATKIYKIAAINSDCMAAFISIVSNEVSMVELERIYAMLQYQAKNVYKNKNLEN